MGGTFKLLTRSDFSILALKNHLISEVQKFRTPNRPGD
jgi:hypothetical protein